MNDEPDSTDRSPATWDLLDGENPNSDLGDDAEHWVTVYSELAQSTRRMLHAAEARIEARRSEAGSNPEVDHRELKYIGTRLSFFEERLRWWVTRGAELAKTGR